MKKASKEKQGKGKAHSTANGSAGEGVKQPLSAASSKSAGIAGGKSTKSTSSSSVPKKEQSSDKKVQKLATSHHVKLIIIHRSSSLWAPIHTPDEALYSDSGFN